MLTLNNPLDNSISHNADRPKNVRLNLETLQNHYDIGINRQSLEKDDEISAPRNTLSGRKSEGRKKSGSFVQKLIRKISMKKEKRGISKI
jgi:hypothetical protein